MYSQNEALSNADYGPFHRNHLRISQDGLSPTVYPRTNIGTMSPTPNFNLPEGDAFAVKIVNQSNQTIFEKTFNNEREFLDLRKNYFNIKSVGFVSTSFKTAQVNTIKDFAKTFFFPTTNMYRVIPNEDAAFKSVCCLLAIIWDLSTVFFRLLTLRYRLYEHQHAPQHPLLTELVEKDLIANTDELYVDVHVHIKKQFTDHQQTMKAGNRIFLNGNHTRWEQAHYLEKAVLLSEQT